jgi:hypothetical protein
MSDYVGCSVTFHGHFNMEERTEAALACVLSVALMALLAKRALSQTQQKV